MNSSSEMECIYSSLGQSLNRIAPASWHKITLDYRVIEGISRIKIRFILKRASGTLQCAELETTESATDDPETISHEMDHIIMDADQLRSLYRENHDLVWSAMLYTLHKDGSFDIDYDYNPQ